MGTKKSSGGSRKSSSAKNPSPGRKPNKETSDKISKLGSKMMRTGEATKKEIRSAGASLLSQDETKGPRKK